MITNETLRKLEQARDLLAEVRGDLAEHEDGSPAPVALLATAILDDSLHSLPVALSEVSSLWERSGKPEAQKAPRITWKRGRFSDHRGTVGGVEAFAIHWHTHREDPNYFITSSLIGLNLGAKHDDLDVLKAVAEESLTAYLGLLGGTS